MYFIYLVFSIVSFFISRLIYNKVINPISIYLFVWNVSILIHESGIIIFYKTELITWYVIFISTFFYMAGCVAGNYLAKKVRYKNINNSTLLEEKLRIIIIICSIIPFVISVVNISNLIRTYGFNIISQIRNIYMDSIMGRRDIDGSSFLSNLVFIALPLAGFYSVRYKFKKFLILPFIPMILGQLANGSRGSIVAGSLLFLAPILLYGNMMKRNKKKVVKIVSIAGVFFFLITYMRGLTGKNPVLTYASPLLKMVSGKSAVLYRVLSYMSNPLGALNEYLKSPVYGKWGYATFRVFRKLLYRFGIIDDFSERVELGIFYTPMQTNVGTYLGEIIKDFRIPGMIVVCFLLGFIFSYSHYRMIKSNSVKYSSISSACFGLVFLSFFAWYLRLIIFWIVILSAVLCGTWIEKDTGRRFIKFFGRRVGRL